MSRRLSELELELMVFLYEKYFTTDGFTPLQEFIDMKVNVLTEEKIYEAFSMLAEDRLAEYRTMGPSVEISMFGILALEAENLAPTYISTRQLEVRRLILQVLESDKKDGVIQDMYHENIIQSANITELEFSANYPVMEYSDLLKRRGEGFSITSKGFSEMQSIRDKEKWSKEYSAVQLIPLTLKEQEMKLAILKIFSEGKKNKFNVLGRPYQKGDLELVCGTIFTPEKRAEAGKIIEEMKKEGLLMSTYSDLADPENWLEITDSGKKALAVGRIKKIFPLHQLTALPQRDQFEEDLLEILYEGGSNALPFSSVYLDLDNLKLLNTEIGQQAADEVIKGFATFMQSQLRNRGSVYHRSGDEFYTILLNTTGTEALELIQRILAELKQMQFQSSKGARQVTFSAGISCYPENGTDLSKLIDCMEQAEKYSKEHGKARVTLCEKPEKEA